MLPTFCSLFTLDKSLKQGQSLLKKYPYLHRQSKTNPHTNLQQPTPDSLTTVISLLTTNNVCSHPPYFSLTQHLSLSAPQDLSAPNCTSFTSHVSSPPRHTSFILLSVAPHSIPAASPPLEQPLIPLSAPLSSHPPSQPPTSVILPLTKTLLSYLPSLIHPVISLSLQPAQSRIGGITGQFSTIHTCL